MCFGDEKETGFILMSVLMDAAMQSDNVYQRKVNGRRGKKDPQVNQAASAQGTSCLLERTLYG